MTSVRGLAEPGRTIDIDWDAVFQKNIQTLVLNYIYCAVSTYLLFVFIQPIHEEAVNDIRSAATKVGLMIGVSWSPNPST